ncbi:hypothetical protein ACFQL9_13995, partial [Halobaculum lipolyticum]
MNLPRAPERSDLPRIAGRRADADRNGLGKCYQSPSQSLTAIEPLYRPEEHIMSYELDPLPYDYDALEPH